jgi:ribonuclease HII
VTPGAPARITGVRDSKALPEHHRERIYEKVAPWCRAWAVGAVTQEECDTLGMSAAQKLAARRALDGLGTPVDVVLIDGNWDFTEGAVHGHQVQKLIKGDARCLSIAAASVLAKVTRDRHMRAEAEHYPQWSFDTNKGYPCPVHKAALSYVGPSAIHRRTWVCMEHLPWPGLRRNVGGGVAMAAGQMQRQHPSLFDVEIANDDGLRPGQVDLHARQP